MMTTKTDVPVRVDPDTKPFAEPVRRYQPDPDHCPGQRVRTVLRVRRMIVP